MGHRVAVMLDGLLQQVDTPRALYETPKNVFVAGFMGSPAMNIKTVPLSDNGAKFGDTLIPLTREQVAAAGEGGQKSVTVGVRPEHCTIADTGIAIEVELVEELGSDAYVYGFAELGNGNGAERFVVRAQGGDIPRLGEIVHIKPQVGKEHIFHAETGERIAV